MSRQACLIVQLIVEFVLFSVYIKFPSKLVINKKNGNHDSLLLTVLICVALGVFN